MTVMRRSQRKASNRVALSTSQYTSDISDIDDAVSEPSDNDEDEDYGRTSRKRKAANSKRGRNNKQKKITNRKVPTTVDEIEDFVENFIFQALSDPDISISELATNWFEEYDENHALALKDLINFVLRCCGCVFQVEEHDVVNNESATETVGEIQQAFVKQQLHEYPLTTTNAKWKNFKTNITIFVTDVLNIANDKGVLCDTEQDFMENILVWLSSFLTAQARPLRYCSTFILLSVETVLCELIVKTSSSLEKQQRQFEMENTKLNDIKKKIDQTKGAREISKLQKEAGKVGRRLEHIDMSVESYKNQKLVLDEYIKDIASTTFVHRYRDIDPKIRQECMVALGQWIDLYPEYFFETSYLRYFGWILSDKDANVRLAVVKSLLKLYRRALIVPGFRQFTERFKGRFIEMATYDSDYTVRLNSISLLLEVTRIGFLEEEEIMNITAMIFCDNLNRVNIICTTDSKYHRLQHEIAKVVKLLEADAIKEFNEKFKTGVLSSENAVTGLQQMIEFKELFFILHNSYQQYLDSYSKLEKQSIVNFSSKMVHCFKTLYLTSIVKGAPLFDALLKYLSFDFSAVDGLDSAVGNRITMSFGDKKLAFSYMAAIASLELVDQNSYYKSVLRSNHSSEKRKTVEDSAEMKDVDLIANKLVQALPQLLAVFKNDEASLETFIDLFGVLVNFCQSREEASKVDALQAISASISSIFKDWDFTTTDETLSATFKQYFSNLTSKNIEFLGQSSRLSVESLIEEICSKLMYDLKQPLDATSVPALSNALNKLLIVGESYDILNSVELEDKVSEKSLVKYLCENCLQNEEVSQSDPSFMSLVFKVLSCYLSWKFESVLADKQQVLLSENFVLSESLKEIAPIFAAVKELIVSADRDANAKYECAIYFLDLIAALKSFHMKAIEKLTTLESDEKLADLNTFFEISVPLSLDNRLEKILLGIFLVKEHQLSKFYDIQLDRDEDEDVNFDTDADSLEDLDEDDLVVKKIERENSLCRLTIKLLILSKMNILSIKASKRLSLNAEQMDSELFKKLFRSSDSTTVVKEEEKESESVPNEEAVEEDVEMEL